jgi:hypothetical protein
MKMKRVLPGVALLVAQPLLAQQHDPAQHAQHAQQAQAGQAGAKAEAEHHAFLQMEREALEQGQGFGMALAADRSGYPGPKHILELKEQLKLSAEQEAAVTSLMAAMKEKARPLGQQILKAEQQLEELFRAGRSEAELREETYRIATLRAQLRWVHLETHLAARKLLTEEQLATYQRVRHGGAGHAHGTP